MTRGCGAKLRATPPSHLLFFASFAPFLCVFASRLFKMPERRRRNQNMNPTLTGMNLAVVRPLATSKDEFCTVCMRASTKSFASLTPAP